MIKVRLTELECMAMLRALRVLLETDREHPQPHALAAYEGAGARQRIAFGQSERAPTFEELGVIAARQTEKAGAVADVDHWAND